MKITLIHPPYRHKIFSENLQVINEEFCVAPPIILAYVVAIMKRAGHTVQLIDAHNEKLPYQAIVHRIKEFKPDLLGFRLETYHLHDTFNLIRFLKKELDSIPVLGGGICLDWYPEECFSHGLIDFGVIGEAISRLPRVLACIAKGESITAIEGTVSRSHGRTTIVPLQDQKNEALDAYPFPARELLNNKLYYSIISQRRNFTIMLTTTGCPCECEFCAAKLFPYRERSVDNVIAEIKECYNVYGVREIDFFDSVLFYNRKRAEELLDRIIDLKYDLEWSCRSRIEFIDEALLEKARQAGCRQIYFGIESGDNHVRDAVKKHMDHDHIRRVLELCRKYDVRALGFFMFGNRGETKESAEKTISYALSLPLDYAQFTMAIAKPFTDYDRERIAILGRDFWREYVSGNGEETYFPRTWTALANDEIIRFVKKAYIYFYFRMHVASKALLRTRSFGELIRYMRVALRVLRNCLWPIYQKH